LHSYQQLYEHYEYLRSLGVLNRKESFYFLSIFVSLLVDQQSATNPIHQRLQLRQHPRHHSEFF
jgi:hypothetical protein